MSIIGIDISDNNGTLDWDRIKKQIDFAMIRVGYGSNYESQDDKQAIRNIGSSTFTTFLPPSFRFRCETNRKGKDVAPMIPNSTSRK